MRIESSVPCLLPGDQIDREVASIAEACLSGEITSRTAMTWLAQLTVQSKVPEEEVDSRIRSGQLRVEDKLAAEEQLRDLLFDKLYPVDGASRVAAADISFDRIVAGASFSSWLRSYSRAILDWTVLRSQARNRAKNGLTETGMLDDFASAGHMPEQEWRRSDDELFVLERRTRGASPDERVVHRASALQRYYGLPELRRPLTSVERDKVRAALNNGELTEVLTRDGGTSSPLQDLFLDFTPEQMESLTVPVGSLLVESSITPLPTIPRQVRRGVTKWAVATAGPGLGSEARTLAALWMEQRSDTCVVDDEVVLKPDSRRIADRHAFWRAAMDLLSRSIYVFGVDVDDISASFLDAYLEIDHVRFLDDAAAAGPSGKGMA